MSARYAEIVPPPELAPFVHCFWVFEGADAAEDQRIVPDGRCELILHYRRPYLERTPEGMQRQPQALFAGQLTRPLHIRADGEAGVIGVRFRTAGAAAYLHGPVQPLTDRRAPLAGLKPLSNVGERIQAATSEAARLAAAAAHVWTEVRLGAAFRDPGVEACVAALRQSEGRTPLDELAGLADRGPRALQRAFAQTVGISPRALAAVMRFRRVFDVLQDATVDTWSAAAQDAGYFDHPQMARDFRRFVGCTPSEFVAARAGLAARLVDLPAA